MRRRTKVVCTIGPSSNDARQIGRLLDAGMNVARLNFSHGSHEDHRHTYQLLRDAAAERHHNLAILQDLQGPKIRTGPLAGGEPVELIDGARMVVTTEEIVGTAEKISTTYGKFAQDVRPDDTILMADGTMELRVLAVNPPEVECEVVRGGLLGEHKGMNLPGVSIKEPSLTEKDREDLDFGIELGVDFVALSFVRTPQEMIDLRQYIRSKGSRAGVIAKIERPEALDHFEEIASQCHAVMVARGDLGVEVDFADVPFIQKHLIHTCNELGVPVITATQMLESMVNHQRPTRAEVADVAGAIVDGTDAVMLSGETAAGQYPIEACATMAKIAYRTDLEMAESPPAERMVRLRTVNLQHNGRRRPTEAPDHNIHADAIGQAVCRMASSLHARRIVCFTTSGYTAAAIARYRPPVPISALTNSDVTWRRCAVIWGVRAEVVEHSDDLDVMIARAEEHLVARGVVDPGDTVILVAGTPFVEGGRTNLLKLHTISGGSP